MPALDAARNDTFADRHDVQLQAIAQRFTEFGCEP
jgi:hypothetical protein